MRQRAIYLMVAGLVVAGMALAATPVSAGNPSITNPPKPTAKVVAKPRFGGAMPLPVDQRIERQNSPEDKLLVEVTHSAKAGTAYVAYVKVVWGDLDNVLKKNGAQFYSKWDGNLKLTSPATGAIDEKVQFDDGKAKAAGKPKAEPKPGTGRDEVDVASGPLVDWDSGVVGALDGLRIKITSSSAAMHGTLTAGKFVIPINITGQAVTTTPPKTTGGTVLTPPGTVYQLK